MFKLGTVVPSNWNILISDMLLFLSMIFLNLQQIEYEAYLSGRMLYNENSCDILIFHLVYVYYVVSLNMARCMIFVFLYCSVDVQNSHHFMKLFKKQEPLSQSQVFNLYQLLLSHIYFCSKFLGY